MFSVEFRHVFERAREFRRELVRAIGVQRRGVDVERCHGVDTGLWAVRHHRFVDRGGVVERFTSNRGQACDFGSLSSNFPFDLFDTVLKIRRLSHFLSQLIDSGTDRRIISIELVCYLSDRC